MPTTDTQNLGGLTFTETMKGWVVPGSTLSWAELEDNPPTTRQPFAFTLTIATDNLREMLENPEHEATMTGSVNAPDLAAGSLPVSGGVFNLFTADPASVETRNMRYRFRFATSAGVSYEFEGVKVIRDRSLVNVWHDTTTLYVTLFQDPEGARAEFARGILHIEPLDFLQQLTTMRVTNAPNEAAELTGLAKFGNFFAGILFRHYGGIFAGPTAFDPAAPPRRKRPLRAGAPELFPVVTSDGVTILLSRYHGGAKGPVMLIHGLGVSSEIFSTDTIDTNLVEFLFAAGYDVWLLDFRASILLPSARLASDGDQVARIDYPAAVAKVREVTHAASIQCVVHCWGATTFLMSMLGGLQGVRSIVSSQIGAFCASPIDVTLKTGLHVPQIFDALGLKSLNAEAVTTEPWWEKIYDAGLKLPAMIFAQGQCTSSTCHRITFMYASLYQHAQLNELTHATLHELFGVANMRAFEHIATVGRAGKLVDFAGQDVYLVNLDRLNLPIAFIHGADNHCFLPVGTAKTYDLLVSRFGASQYSRHVIPGYGHIDCIFGKNAATDVFPFMVEHLDKTN